METKRAKVIMLPTKEKLETGFTSGGDYYYDNKNSSMGVLNKEGTRVYKHHLYFITDDEIKEGDWFINDDGLWKCSGGIIPTGLNPNKVVATTDKLLQRKDVVGKNDIVGYNFNNLYLPKPSQAFIEKYCDKEGIDEVNIEVDIICDESNEDKSNLYLLSKLKVDPNHNTVTIHPIKTTWSREEIEEIIHKYSVEINEQEGMTVCSDDSINEFITKTL